MNNIYLVGMMGSGKSATGRQLAEATKRVWLDFDHALEQKQGMSVPAIFKSRGEIFFREEESRLLDELSRLNDRVVSTGGGVVLLEQNVRKMRDTGKIVFLRASLENLWNRLKDKSDRPLLACEAPRQKLEKIWEERKERYTKAADFEIQTDGKSVEEVVSEIMEKLFL